MATKKAAGNKMVLITTERRGVFVGRLESYDDKTRVAVVTDARMAIYWGTTRGLFELAETGPTSKSKISAKVERVRLELCECIVDVSAAAEAAWTRV